MHVWFVFDWLEVGGAATELLHLARHLDPERFRLRVAATALRSAGSEFAVARLRSAGVPVELLPPDLPDEERPLVLADALERDEADVLVACQGAWVVRPALRLLARPPALIEYGSLVQEVSLTPKEGVAAYVGSDRAVCEAATRFLPEPGRVVYLPAMVDLGAFARDQRPAARRELRAGPRDFLFGWVGRLERKQRVEDLLRAAARIVRQFPEARFAIVGGPDPFMPEYEAELRARARPLGLQERVLFTGYRSDVPRLMTGFDALVRCSRGEGIPHVVVEAGAARLPVIVTPEADLRRELQDEHDCLFSPYADPDALVRRMARLLRERELGAALGERLLTRVATDFSTATLVPRWALLLTQVALERSPHRGRARVA